jgi:hypothetical protein
MIFLNFCMKDMREIVPAEWHALYNHCTVLRTAPSLRGIEWVEQGGDDRGCTEESQQSYCYGHE